MATYGEDQGARQAGDHGSIPVILVREQGGVVFMDSGYDLSWAWGIGLAAFAAGIACGLAIGFLLQGNRRRAQELEEELAGLHRQFDSYRDQVNRHFLTTSELVQKMTDSYRDVYEHLAAGSAALCQTPVTTPNLDFTRHPVLENPPQTPTPEETGTEKSADAETDPLQDSESDTLMGDAPYVPRLETEDPVNRRTP
jgi:uncharacterized membrane-anchored protein YhcB (DUF1043 family)